MSNKISLNKLYEMRVQAERKRRWAEEKDREESLNPSGPEEDRDVYSREMARQEGYITAIDEVIKNLE